MISPQSTKSEGDAIEASVLDKLSAIHRVGLDVVMHLGVKFENVNVEKRHGSE